MRSKYASQPHHRRSRQVRREALHSWDANHCPPRPARGGQTQADILYRERRGAGALGEAKVFLRTPAQEMEARFSPDGRYLAYISGETGRNEIYIRHFPHGQRKWKVSAAGGKLMAAPLRQSVAEGRNPGRLAR